MSFGMETLKFNKAFLVSLGCIFNLSGLNKQKSIPLSFNCFGPFVPFSTVNFVTLFVPIAFKNEMSIM